MKTKVISILLTCGLVALAAWYVQRSDTNNAPDPFAPVVRGGERNVNARDVVPEKYRETVHKGLEYLAKHQHKDGHWEGDDGKHPVAMTGLVGLALDMERTVRRGGLGQTVVSETKYPANVQKAADWLMERCKPGRDGLIFSDHVSETDRYMEGHGFATIFLAGVYMAERDDARRKKLTDVLMRAVKYIVKARSTQGGWYHTSKVEGHDLDAISTTAIQVQALLAAENAGIPVPREAINDAKEYAIMALKKYDRDKSAKSHNRLADTAAALPCRSKREIDREGLEATDNWRQEWFQYCQAEIPVGRNIKFGRDELIHYYYAQEMLCHSDDYWNNYRTVMFDHLQSAQNKDGSWPPGDGIGVGPVYSTAVWCVILQLGEDRHPSIRKLQSVIY